MKKLINFWFIFYVTLHPLANANSEKDYKGKSSLDIYNIGMSLREQYRGKEEILKEIDGIAEELILRDGSDYQGFLLKSWVLKREAYINSSDGYIGTKFQKSLDYLNSAITKKTTSLDIYPATISSMVIIGDFKKAEKLLEEFKKKINQSNELERNFDYYIELANLNLKQHKFDESRKSTTDCLVYAKNNAQKADCLYYKADSFTLEKNYNASMDVYNNILQLTPDDPWTLSNLSSVYYNLGRYDDAIAAAEKGIGIRTFGMIKNNLSWGYYGKATEFLKAGDRVRALEYFKKNNPDDLDLELAEFLGKKLFYNSIDTELFLKVVQSSLTKFPESPKLNFLMGEYFYFTKKDYKEAITSFHKAEEMFAKYNDNASAIGTLSRLGSIYSINLKEHSKALEYYIKLKPFAEISKEPSIKGDMYYGLGRCYHEIGWTKKDTESSKLGLFNYQEALKFLPEKKDEIEKNIKNIEANIKNFSKS